MPKYRRLAPAIRLAALMCLLAAGCVRRTITIDTDPQGAIVHLNDVEIGPTPVKRDFTFYGDYDVVIRKDGYETLLTHAEVKAPWYQVPPIDFFADVLWPGQLHDRHHFTFQLDERELPEHEAVVSRALDLRDRAAE